MTSHLSADDIAAAEEIGRSLPPLGPRQEALIRDFFGPLIRAQIAERKAREKAAEAA